MYIHVKGETFFRICAIIALFILVVVLPVSAENLSPIRPPQNPVKLIFIHHSTGQNWLADDNGGLGIALRDNNYFVSDTNYDWGPESIGSTTDIGDWWTWFRSPRSPEILAELFNESNEHSEYSRLSTDPGGQNKIVMFKSCFPNSNLGGNPTEPVPPIEDNLLKANASNSEYHTVANAKGIYIDLLNYFRTKPDILFVVIAAPPLSAPENSANARVFNQWLVNDWLAGYNQTNVAVWDFYNVLTTNGGNPTINDLNETTGNHHRWWNDGIQHAVNLSFNTSAYPLSESDDHPTMAGNLKASGEYVPLLNYAYNQWAGNNTSPVANFTANITSGTSPLTVHFSDASTGSPTSWNWSFGDGNFSMEQNPMHIYSSVGTYTVSLNATNADGSNTTTKTDYITVNPPAAPVADFSANSTSGKVPLTVHFTDTSTGSPTIWNWSFSDENFTEAWTQMSASAGWSARRAHSSVVMPDGSIVLMGGDDSGDKNDVWRSTDNGATWMQMNASAGWSARRTFSSVAMPDGSIVLMGCHQGEKNDTWRSTDNGITWTLMNASAGWSGRGYHSSVAMLDGSIMLMGGYDSSGYKDDVWRSTDFGVTWTLMNASAGWTVRVGHISVVMPDGSIVLMGGYDGGYKNDVWRSTDYGATWTQVSASAGWTVRGYHSGVAMPDGSIVLMGGSDDSGYKNDVWRSTDYGATWTHVNASAGWTARRFHSSVAMPDGSVVLMGGEDSGGYKNDVWRFMRAGSSAQNPSHTYTRPGTYSVSLNVTNAGGSNTTVKTNYIAVYPKGDFNTNWRVDIGDVTWVAYMAVNLTALDPAADFNGDTKVDIGDASKIAWYYVGKIPEI